MAQITYVAWMNRAEMAIGEHAPLKILDMIGIYNFGFHFRKAELPTKRESRNRVASTLSYCILLASWVR